MIEFNFAIKEDGENLKPISQLIKSEFADDKEYIIAKIGEWSFYQTYENIGVSYLEFLEFIQQSFQAKRDQHIYRLATQKLKAIAPTQFNCDPELYALSKGYRTWFILRNSFYEKIKNTLAEKDNYYFEWNTTLDNRTPEECIQLNGKIFEANQAFIRVADKHWGEVHEHCRCGIYVLTRRRLSRRKTKAP